MKARMHAVGDALAGLAGARLDLLARDPGARTRYITLAGALLSTGALATMSAAFTLHMTMGASWPVAVPFGLLWGVMIVNLDRLLVVSMRHDPSGKRNWPVALPRVVLALILGIVIATPVTLQVFHTEIDNKVVDIQREQADAFRASLANDKTFNALQQKVDAENAIKDNGGTTDPALATVRATVQAEQDTFDTEWQRYLDLEKIAQGECDGTSGTGVPGFGPQCRQKQQDADTQKQVALQAQDAWNAALKDEAAAEQRSVQQAKTNLATDQPALDKLKNDRKQRQQEFDKTNAADTGLLIRIQALGRLTSGNSTLGLAHLIVELLFICFELLPVLSKLFMLSRPTAYDHLLAAEDQVIIDAARAERDKRNQLAEQESELDVAVARDRISRQRQLGLSINAEVVKQQRRIITQALKVWGEHTERVAADQLADYQRHLHTRQATYPAPPFIDGTDTWDTPGPVIPPAPQEAPWSNPPAGSNEDLWSLPKQHSSPASEANFVVDPSGASRMQSPFVAAADLPSAEDL